MIENYLARNLPSFDWPNFNYMLRDICSSFAERTAFRYRSRGAKAFEEFLLSPETQAIIQNFGADKYGQPLFFPDAVHKIEEPAK